MPFKSEKQRRYLWAEHPEIAKEWAHKYPESNKNLPLYAGDPKKSDKTQPEPDTSDNDMKEKAAVFLTKLTNPDSQININIGAYVNNCNSGETCSHSRMHPISTKFADSKQERVEIPHSEEPTYAGEEREKGMLEDEISLAKNVSGDSSGGNKRNPENAINSLLQKISVVLAPAVEQTMENLQAEREGRVPRRVGKNRGIKQYPVSTPTIPLPLGMQQPAQPAVPANHDHYANSKAQPVGGGSNPMANPINAFGAISSTGNINGNAAFGAKNSPDSSKIAEVIKRANKSDALAKIMSLDTVDPNDVDYYNEEYEEELAGRALLKAAGEDALEHDLPAEKKPVERPSLLTTGLVGAGAGLGAFALGKALDASGYSPSKLVQPYLPEAPDWLKNLGTRLEDYMTPKTAQAAIEKQASIGNVIRGIGSFVGNPQNVQNFNKAMGAAAAMLTPTLARRAWAQQNSQPAANSLAAYAPYAAGAAGVGALGLGALLYARNRKPAAKEKEKAAGVATADYANYYEAEMAKTAGKSPAWQRAAGKNEEGGLNEKGRKSYEREHGGNLKAPVTQKNPKGEAKKRQNSFCARMCGMKRVNTGAGTAKDPDSRINKSLRKWNCKCSSAMEFGMKLAAAPFALGPSNNPKDVRNMLAGAIGPQQTQAYQQRVQRGTTAMNQLMGRGQTAPAAPHAGGGAPTVRSALLGGTRGAVGQSLFPGPK